MNKRLYKWFYDNIESRFYNLLIKWCSIPIGGEAKFRRTMIQPVSFEPAERILEMCCGTGGATLCISEKAHHESKIIGVDLSSGQLKYAIKRNYYCSVHFIEGDVTQACFSDGSFDKVFITHAIHEMPRNLRLQTLNEARRVLRENGEIIVFEMDNPPSLLMKIFVGFWCFYWLPVNFETSTRRDMFRFGLVNEVRENGFADIKKYSMHRGVLQTVVGKKP